MKKIFATLLMLAVMLTSTVTFAAFKDEISEGVNLSDIKRVAIILPMHFKIEDEEPSLTEFTRSIFDMSKKSSREIIPYNHIADNIIMDTGIDILSLPDEDARRVFKQHVAKYADSYLLVTTANNIKKTQFFFDLFDSKTGNLLYTFTLQGGGLKKNAKDYGRACELFYEQFDLITEQQIKDNMKAEKAAAKEARKQAKKKNKD